MDIGISVIIPAYNEEKSIGQTIEAMNAVLSKGGFVYEIIVVDDGSTDKTADNLQAEGVNLIRHDSNHGYGSAIKTGVRHSKYDIILIIDADGTYPVEEVPAILRNMEHYDMVVGARIGSSVRMPLLRKTMKWMLVKLANYLSDSNIRDLNSGLRALKKDIFYKFNRLLPDGFSLTTTITLAMLTNGYRLKYIPINYHARVGKSKFRPVSDTLSFIQLIIRTSLLFNPLKIFIPISMIMFLASFLVFSYSLFFLPRILDVTSLILFVGGMQILAIGMIADLIDKRTI